MNEICHLQGGFPGALFDLTPSDWAWRGIRGGLFKLHPDWAMDGKTGKFDAVQMLSHDISIKDPDLFTQRRCIYATAGSMDRHENRRTDYVFEGKSLCVPDPERLGGNFFNQKHGDCLTLEACLDLWSKEHGAVGGPTCPPIEPQPFFFRRAGRWTASAGGAARSRRFSACRTTPAGHAFGGTRPRATSTSLRTPATRW